LPRARIERPGVKTFFTREPDPAGEHDAAESRRRQGLKVFNVEPKTIQRIAAHIQRVLIVDPIPGASRLLGELMKEMGAREILVATHSDRALNLTREFEPQLIFTEFGGPDVDGLAFTQALRRSACTARKAPVIMVTAEATQQSIIGARNAGVHEFLRKPYTAGDLFRRVENVSLKSRPWIEAVMYVGPDRRRFNSGEFVGSKKRRSDAFQAKVEAKAG